MRAFLIVSATALALATPAFAQTSTSPTAPSTAPGAANPPAPMATPAQNAADAMKSTGQSIKDGARAAGEMAKDAAQATGQAVKSAAESAGAAMSRAGKAVSATAADLADGWAVTQSVIGKSVYDEANTRIGEIDDIILAGDMATGAKVYAVVGVGGFLGIGERKVATPLAGLRRVDDRFVMPGATKEDIGAWPEYRYTRSPAAGAPMTPANAPVGAAPAPKP
jgi:hypothetical protein